MRVAPPLSAPTSHSGDREGTREHASSLLSFGTRDGSGALDYRSSGCAARAEAFARALQVDARYGEQAHIGNAMNQVLVEAVGQGRPLPAAVVVTSTVFFARYRKRAAFHPAQADYYEDVIYINPESYWFRSRHALRKYARRAYRGGQIATDDPAHLLRHEYGHLLHKSAAGSAGLPAEAVSAPDRIEQAGRAFLDGLHRWPEADRRFKEAAARVSVRAADSPVEFVAEVFAGAWGGRRFHEDVAVMEGYRHYRGPVLLPRG